MVETGFLMTWLIYVLTKSHVSSLIKWHYHIYKQTAMAQVILRIHIITRDFAIPNRNFSITGDQEISCHIYRVDEHCVASRAHSVQPTHQSCTHHTDQPAEGHQRSCCDVVGAWGGVYQHDEWEGAGGLGGQVVPLAETTRQLYDRFVAEVKSFLWY